MKHELPLKDYNAIKDVLAEFGRGCSTEAYVNNIIKYYLRENVDLFNFFFQIVHKNIVQNTIPMVPQMVPSVISRPQHVPPRIQKAQKELYPSQKISPNTVQAVQQVIPTQGVLQGGYPCYNSVSDKPILQTPIHKPKPLRPKPSMSQSSIQTIQTPPSLQEESLNDDANDEYLNFFN